jgi:hypothetical protein
MKTGIIVYVVGAEPESRIPNLKAAVKTLKLSADRVEIASRFFGHFDIHDAWWSLTAKGMEKIVCMLAEFAPHGTLQLNGRELRLCG